jgi:regulator of replication initiation timing
VENTEVTTFNKIIAMVFGSDQDGESATAIKIGKKFLKDRSASIADFTLVSANSQAGYAGGTGLWERQVQRLFKDLDAKDSALQSVRAEADALRRERDELRAKLGSRIEVKPAKARADAKERELAELRTTLGKTTTELDAANCARDEAEVGADAVRRENDELRAALQETTAELHEARRVADVLRDAAANNGPAEVAETVADHPTDSAGAEEDHPETAESSADTDPSNETAAGRQQGWKPNFDAKAVGIYWRTVTGINADLAAGLITTRQASGRKAAAFRSYKVGVKPVRRARMAKRAA